MATLPIDKVRKAVDNERLRENLLEGLSEAQEWADQLTELADAIAEANTDIEGWVSADREDGADCRKQALESLATVISAYEELDDSVRGLFEPD